MTAKDSRLAGTAGRPVVFSFLVIRYLLLFTVWQAAVIFLQFLANHLAVYYNRHNVVLSKYMDIQ